MLQLDEVWSLVYDGKTVILKNSETREVAGPLDGIKIRAGRGTQTAASLVRDLAKPYGERSAAEQEIYNKFLGVEEISAPKSFPVTTVPSVDEFGKPYSPPKRIYDRRPVVM